eukprot:gene2699-3120_t
MPGDNCSIYGCSVSRRSQYKGISLFKVPSGEGKFETNWRQKLNEVITKDRVIDGPLRARINNKKLFICQRHFAEDQYHRHGSKCTLVPGVIPTLNLPIKSIPSSSSAVKPRKSADAILEKKSLHASYSEPVGLVDQPVECYQSFYEFSTRANTLKLTGWNTSNDVSNILSFSFADQVHMVPKYEIHVEEDLSFTVRMLLWSLPATHALYTANQRSVKYITISNLIKLTTALQICPGLPNQFIGGCIEHSVPKLYDSTAENPLHQSKWYRPPSCLLLIPQSSEKCAECIIIESREKQSLKRKRDNLTLPAKLKAPISSTSSERVKLTLQNYRFENKKLKEEIIIMQEEISQNSLKVDNKLSNDFISIMSGTDETKIPPFMKLFWEEQQKYLSSSKTNVRYHPMIIRYCLGLAAKSPAVYDEIRFDEKTNSGFVVLPSRRRLRDYKNDIRPKQGFNKDVIQELSSIMSQFQDIEKYGILLLDEMKIKEDLVWDKHTGDLIGFVNLGDPELNFATLKKSNELASHVLVFLLRSIVNPLKFSFANFATTNAKSTQLFPLFWKAVGILEDKCGVKVVGVTSDGASANRSMYRMHLHMTRVEDINADVDVVYRTRNVMAEEERYIYFLSDVPHLLKTARNCLRNSFAGSCTRGMWNNGDLLTWNHISKLFHDDLDCGLHLVPKLTNDHINLSSFSVMNVRLAAQVLSESVSQALQTFGPPEAGATALYCQMFDKFFDCLNVRNTSESVRKAKPFLQPYQSEHDERFTWLTGVFLKYLADWKDSVDARPGEFSDHDRGNMFISWQTYEGVKITVHSSIELVQYLLCQGVPYILTERFCQDPLENYFGRQRSLGHRKDNPSLRDVGYNDNTIRTTKLFRPITGNCRNDDPEIAKIDVETVLPRKK